MTRLIRVSDVECGGRRVLSVGFSDGVVRELDFADRLPGALSSIDDDVVFAAVSIDPVAGTVCWANGIDLDPAVLHGDLATVPALQPRLVREYRLQQTG